jgi:hypothetical protein
MAEQNKWDAVYRDLIAKGRERVGEPPSPETLVAYSRGELPGTEAARVRESLAYYPDLAKALAEGEQAEDDAPPYLSKAQLDADWQSLRRQLTVRRIPLRRPSRPWQWATAASLLLAVVCATMWFHTWNDLQRPHTDVQRVELFDDSARGPGAFAKIIRPASDTRFLVLSLTLAAPTSTDDFRTEIVDSNSTPPHAIWNSSVRRGQDGTFTIEVPVGFLHQGSYRINLYEGKQAEPVATYSVTMTKD